MPVKLANIEHAGCVPTYDIEVEGRRHNFIADGIVVHNSYNEISSRYTEVKDEFYVPDEFRIQDKLNKQGSLKTDGIDNKKLLEEYSEAVKKSYETYQKLISAGVAREMARMVLPVCQYTQFYWTVNARSLMNFLALRLDEHAQFEIREYAKVLADIFKDKMPWTWEAFSKSQESENRESRVIGQQPANK